MRFPQVVKAGRLTSFAFALSITVAQPPYAQASRARFITVDTGVTLEVLDWGGFGQPVVLIPGNGQTAHSFDDFAPSLARFYHVYGITRRGFGASSKPADGYRADRRADDVLAVIDSLGIAPPVLAGHSLGGEELSSIGSRYPHRVAGLVYLDASDAYYDTTRAEFMTDAAEFKYHLNQLQELGSLGKAAAMDSLLTVMLQTDLPAFQRGFTAMQQAARQLPPVVSYSLMPPPRTGVARLIDEGRQRYTAIRAPALAFFAIANPPAGVGTDSAATRRWLQQDPERAGRFARGVPDARVVVLPNAHHFVFRSNEAQVIAEMRSFIDRLPAR